MTLCSTGSPWHQGQQQMIFRIFRVLAFFPGCPFRGLVVFRFFSSLSSVPPIFSSRTKGGGSSIMVGLVL
jgi:hypothetical protein